jgi:hypothetical protein
MPEMLFLCEPVLVVGYRFFFIAGKYARICPGISA